MIVGAQTEPQRVRFSPRINSNFRSHKHRGQVDCAAVSPGCPLLPHADMSARWQQSIEAKELSRIVVYLSQLLEQLRWREKEQESGPSAS